MARRVICALGVAAFWSTTASAMTGAQFMETMALDRNGVAATAYMHGIGEMNAVNRTFKGDTKVMTYCMPAGADYRQAVAIAAAALRDHPAGWHLQAIQTILPALVRAWPCAD